MDEYGSTQPVPLRTGENTPGEPEKDVQQDFYGEQNAAAEGEFEELTAVLQAAQEGEQQEQAQEEESAPDWDGSEAEFVPDEDAAEYEEHYTGIKLTYTLKRKEIMACLKKGGYYSAGRKAIIETGILGLLAVMFLASWFIYGGTNNIGLFAVCLVVIAVIWLVPYFDMRGYSRHHSGTQTHVCIYPDEVVVGKEGSEWAIELDGTSALAEFADMMVLFTPEKQVIAIPLRAVEPAVLADVQAMLVAGTVPKKD